MSPTEPVAASRKAMTAAQAQGTGEALRKYWTASRRNAEAKKP